MNSEQSTKTAHKTLHAFSKLNNFLVLIILLAIPFYVLLSKNRNKELPLTGRLLGVNHSETFEYVLYFHVKA